MYNIILALVLTCSLGGIVFLLNQKRKIIRVESAAKKEETVSEENRINNLRPKVTELLSGLKVKREVLENITEKGLRRLRVFVLRVDNRLVNSIGKLKEDKISPFVDNGRIEALINTQEVKIIPQEQPVAREETVPPKTETDIWFLEQSYLNNLESHFDIETFSKLADLYLDLGDFSTLRGKLLEAINSDLSWDDIMSEPRLVESFEKLAENDSSVSSKARSIKSSMSLRVHQRKKKA